MRRIGLALAFLVGATLSGCVSYGGISKAADGKVYLTGSTSYLIFGTSWVKRCTESGAGLTCEKLSVSSGGSDEGGDEDPKPKKHKREAPPADE